MSGSGFGGVSAASGLVLCNKNRESKILYD